VLQVKSNALHVNVSLKDDERLPNGFVILSWKPPNAQNLICLHSREFTEDAGNWIGNHETSGGRKQSATRGTIEDPVRWCDELKLSPPSRVAGSRQVSADSLVTDSSHLWAIGTIRVKTVAQTGVVTGSRIRTLIVQHGKCFSLVDPTCERKWRNKVVPVVDEYYVAGTKDCGQHLRHIRRKRRDQQSVWVLQNVVEFRVEPPVSLHVNGSLYLNQVGLARSAGHIFGRISRDKHARNPRQTACIRYPRGGDSGTAR